MTEVHGWVAAGFEAVSEAFVLNFQEYDEEGAACSIVFRGEPVVDIWGGCADVEAGIPWDKNTLELVFSAAKALTATCILMLVERGKLDLDEPIASYWPEFGVNGKERISARMVLSHRAGLAAVDGELTLEEVLAWDPVVEAIARQEPNWTPGTGHGYHARSFGWILGELLRRIEGISLGQFLQREIAQPLGIDLFIGLPESELPRCSKVVPPEGGMEQVARLLGSTSLTYRVMHGPSGLFDYNDMWNRADVLACEMPSSNAVTNGRSLARFYAALIGDIENVSLLSPATVKAACETHSKGPDKVLLADTHFGLGYGLSSFVSPSAGPESFGHAGAGGSLGFADPAVNIGFGYVANKMRFDLGGDPRAQSLVNAMYRCI